MSYRRISAQERLHKAAAGAASSVASVAGSGAALLLLGGLVALSARALTKTHLHRRASRAPALPERLQTWEGEGGGLTEGAQQADARPMTHQQPV